MEKIMIGITLSSEQIRTAPPEVRQWIEREVMTSLGQPSQPAEASKPHGEHLAACSEEEVTALLSQIQGVLPAVNVFFEFGRQGAIFGQPRIEAFRLLDIAHHTRLANVAQVVACLDIINQAFSRVCGDATAKFCGFDREGHCFIAMETQQSILHLWQKVIASQQLTVNDQEKLASSSEPGAVNSNAQPVPQRQPAFEGNETAA
jgi:hypothetical protein